MDHFRNIYRHHAAEYQQLIACEDVEGNLLRALRAAAPPQGLRVLDVGSGTGRLTRLLQDDASALVAIDLHAPMLREQRRLQAQGRAWPLLQGDARRLPFAGGSFDLVVAGWALGHFCGWYGERWRQEIHAALVQMARVARPGGALVIIETLSTGSAAPHPPTPALARYYDWLESAWGFQRATIATDYLFPSVSAAVDAVGFFFGEALAQQVARDGAHRVPEWTGVWHRPT